MLVSRETPGAELFASLEPVNRYIDILTSRGVEWGLIGPREAPKVWDRHVLNCAQVMPRLTDGATVADVGSGAGLPGLVWAIGRPDLHVTLVEPLLRRSTFLSDVTKELGLSNVEVIRARAEEVRDRQFDVVTSRAVARLDRLGAMCLPLVARPDGVLLALKGKSAADEVTLWTTALRKAGGADIVVASYGAGPSPTTVVEVSR